MRAFVPEIKRLPRRRVLTVTSIGLPDKVAQRCVNALFGTAYGTKFKTTPANRRMKVGPLACRWMNALEAPASKWEARWGLQVSAPLAQRDLMQADPKTRVKVADWDYDLVAQILHEGPYAEEWPSIEKLHAFMSENGYRIIGPHEEEYLTRPDVKVPRTIIRYRVKKQAGAVRRAAKVAAPGAKAAKPAARKAAKPAPVAGAKSAAGAKPKPVAKAKPAANAKPAAKAKPAPRARSRGRG